MKKLNAAIFTKCQERVDYVYGEKGLQILSEITNFNPQIVTPENIDSLDLSELEAIFSTWGMFAPTDEQFEKMPKLKAVFYAAGATDGFCRPFLARGIKVISAWQANSIPVAEFCVAQIILGLKNYFNASRLANKRETYKQSNVSCGSYGASIGLIGAGAISKKVEELLKNYNLNVIVVPSRKENRTVSLEELFAKCQVISNHLPDRDDNVGVINGKHFSSMLPKAVFINTGRGRQVNEEELIATFKERTDLSALLDVTYPEPPLEDSELYTMENIYLTPHIAGSMNDEVNRMADYMFEEYNRFIAGEKLLYEINEKMLLTS